MRRDTSGVFAIALAVLVLAAMPAAVLADDDEKAEPSYTMIHYEDVGPANALTYEENSKAWVAAFKEAEAGAEWGWRMYSGPNFNYAYLTDVPNYASLDSADERWAAVVEVVGKDKIDELSADGGGATGHRHELTKDLPEYDYTPESGVGEVGFVHLATHSVKPGMGEQYKALVAKVTEARNKVGGGLAVRVSKVEFGNGSYQFAVLAKDAASYYSATSVGAILTEAYGPEESQKMFADWRECITDFETSDWRFKPELSYMPGMVDDEEMMDDKEEMADEEEMSEGE
ncbi:MAG: hypothetical protein IH936_02150 [Acidobacteria bacterium]|nr:hypothetical protein [Acidobacteriota bacterium]